MNATAKVGAVVLAALGIGLGVGGTAQADPDDGCYSPLPWAVCNQPWNNYPPGSWDFNPEPGQWGPGGYHYCDTSEGCGN